MLICDQPAVVLAPMDGVTDAPMREFLGSRGGFSWAVSEFVRVSVERIPAKVFRRDIPELLNGARTPSGLPVQVQILGGHPERMAQTAAQAVIAGATAIDLNFGCPAPTVNRNDGGASLLREPCRIEEIVRAVREAVPPAIPVSAKLRLGWDDISAIDENAKRVARGGAAWITIHARTRIQGYRPPVYWPAIRRVREAISIPVIANGDIWDLDDFRRCQDETGCLHYMLGRGALANPGLAGEIARELGLPAPLAWNGDWRSLFEDYVQRVPLPPRAVLAKLKQWARLANAQGNFPRFDDLKVTESVEDFLAVL